MPAKSKTVAKSPAKSAAKPVASQDVPSFFKMTVEVNDLDRAMKFYAELLGIGGKKLSGGRAHFECGPVILQVVDVSASGPSHPSAKSLYFAVRKIDAFHKRARKLKCCSLELVHGKPGGAVYERPWGERSFYADDPWFNTLCFVEAGTEFKG